MNFYHEYECPENIINEILNDSKSVDFSSNLYNLVGTTKYNANSKLINFINECLLEIRHKYFSNKLNFEITSCWLNKCKKNQKHHRHSHINSLLSGILYLTSHKSGQTIFLIPNPWVYLENLNIFSLSKDPSVLDLSYEIFPKKGKLIIFPSQIKHYVKENLDDQERITVAFNVFINGILGENATTYLKINKSIKYG